MAESGRDRAKFGRISANDGGSRAKPKSGPIWSNLGRCDAGPTLAESGTCRAEIGPVSVEFGPILDVLGTTQVEIGRSRAIFGRSRAAFCRNSAGSDECEFARPGARAPPLVLQRAPSASPARVRIRCLSLACRPHAARLPRRPPASARRQRAPPCARRLCSTHKPNAAPAHAALCDAPRILAMRAQTEKVPEQVSRSLQAEGQEPRRLSRTEPALDREAWRQAVKQYVASTRGGAV